MIVIEKIQRAVEVAGVKIGGQVGEYPTLIMGLLFFQGDRLVKNVAKGEFDKKASEEAVLNFLNQCSRTGVQGAIAVQGSTPSAIIRYVDWVADLDFYQGPIIVDAPNEHVRLPAMAHGFETGIRDRLIYDSIHPDSPDEEFEGLREHEVQNCVIMASNSRNMWPEGRIEVLSGVGSWEGSRGLIDKLLEIGVQNIFIDTAVIGAVESIMACDAVRLVKEEFGWPVGAGTTNAVDSLAKTQRSRLKTSTVFQGILGMEKIHGALTGDAEISSLYRTLDTTFALAALFGGADYLFAGAIESAQYLVPAVAAFDAMMGYYYTRILKGKIRDKKHHPLYRFMT